MGGLAPQVLEHLHERSKAHPGKMEVLWNALSTALAPSFAPYGDGGLLH